MTTELTQPPREYHFKKGASGNPDGRVKGSRNKMTRALKDAMILAAEELGDLSGIAREDLSQEGVEQGKQGLVGYLKWLGKMEPRSFADILGKLIPLQVKVDSFAQTVYQSVEELQHDVAQRGLNMRAFGQLMLDAHQAKSGEYATVINGPEQQQRERDASNGHDAVTERQGE